MAIWCQNIMSLDIHTDYEPLSGLLTKYSMGGIENKFSYKNYCWLRLPFLKFCIEVFFCVQTKDSDTIGALIISLWFIRRVQLSSCMALMISWKWREKWCYIIISLILFSLYNACFPRNILGGWRTSFIFHYSWGLISRHCQMLDLWVNVKSALKLCTCS